MGKKLVTVQLLILDIAKYINSEAAASYNSIADKTYGYFLTILAGTHKKVKTFLSCKARAGNHLARSAEVYVTYSLFTRKKDVVT